MHTACIWQTGHFKIAFMPHTHNALSLFVLQQKILGEIKDEICKAYG
jgi:hypothetical protein